MVGQDRRLALRGLALIRLAVLPVLYAGQKLVGHPQLEVGVFDALFGVLALYAAVAAWLAFQGRPGPLWLYGALDVVAVTLLTYASGGAASELRRTFFVMPIAAAFLTKPRLTLVWATASLAGYFAAALPPPPVGERLDQNPLIIFGLSLAWIGLSSVVLSEVLTRRAARIRELVAQLADLAASRGRHVASALDAEDRERRRLADALHDSALQTTLAARQDLADAEGGDRQALGRAADALDEVIAQLREQVFDLHPQILEYAGLQAALEALAERQGRRGGFSTVVTVAPDAAGIDDQLLMALARELLVNIGKHADARRASVSVRRVDDMLELFVVDDGCGFDTERRQAALREGHIGLASAAERVLALGGDFEITSAVGSGTVIRVLIPVERERRRVPRARLPLIRSAVTRSAEETRPEQIPAELEIEKALLN